MTEEKKPQVQEKENTLRIEVSKYSSLLNILGAKWTRVIWLTFIAWVLLFGILACVAIVIKRLYPYSDITTNAMGATTIKSEKNEVSYWLLNTASFWSSTGITVEKGDIITVRSSGKFNTSIHHIYDSAKENKRLKDKWVGAEGEPDKEDENSSSYQRRLFRMFPSLPTGALVMQVAANENELADTPSDSCAKKENFYFIGAERQNIYINNPGTLYFTVNDIVLNHKTICGMLNKTIKGDKSITNVIKESMDKELGSKKTLKDSIETMCKYYKEIYKGEIDYLNEKGKENSKIRSIISDLKTANREEFSFANTKSWLSVFDKYNTDELPQRIIKKVDLLRFYIEKNDKEDARKVTEELISEMETDRVAGGLKLGIAKYGLETVNELEYYYRTNYKEAWYDDNVGSFLVVVEKNSKK